MSQREEGNKRNAVSIEQCTLIFMTIYLPRGVSPSHLASLASEIALCWRRKYNRGEEVVLKTGPRALQRHLPSSPGTRDSEGGMGRLRREVQWYLFLKDITVSTEMRTFGVSCELCRWVSFRAKRHTAALRPAFGCLLRGKDLPGTSVCMDYKYVLISILNDLLVINLYRSDDPSVLQWLKHCGNSTLKTSFFKRTLLMTIVKSFTFGK